MLIMTLRKMLTSGFVCLASAGSCFGQSEGPIDKPGVVRLSDRPISSASPTIRQGMNSAPSARVQPTGFHRHQQGAMTGGCPHCQGSGCPSCQAGHGSGQSGTPCYACQGRGCQFCTGLLGCLEEKHCKLPPDYGYSIPGKYPIERRGVQYFRYFPAEWYGGQSSGIDGQARAYPQVYQPTDTTQQGFYYQHVPAWSPVYSPLPERPRPEQWHNFAPTVHPINRGHGFRQAGYQNYGNGYHQGHTHGGSCPPAGDQGTIMPSPTVQPAMPAEAMPYRDAPTPPATTIPARPLIQDSAREMNLRRASY